MEYKTNNQKYFIITKRYFTTKVKESVLKEFVKNPIKPLIILELMFYLGIRRGEIPYLRLSDLNKDKKLLRIHNKNRKFKRTIRVPQKLLERLNFYLEYHNKIGTAGIDKIFRRLKPYFERKNFNPSLLIKSYLKLFY